MENEDAVITPAEQTVETESAPVENQDANIQPEEESPVESNQPETKVSESVPYDRFHSVNSEKARLAEENAWLKSQMSTTPAPLENTPYLDPESEAGVRAVARQEWDEMERQKFISKHKAELDNNLPLAGTVRELIARENAMGKMADRESILEQAKKILGETIKPAVKVAQSEGFKEGQQKAIEKGQTGAVGSTSYKEPVLDDSALSASEFANKYKVSRI